ncbi:MAG: hypothetical protein NTZ33_03420 [Bacteroidetes bacterium]|nr:hypothetical protein [Bacteroidota bacterium]
MEVHHHPDVRNKNLKEYVFEGLMIFMAVTMGFFAEKIRENIADHNKEKEYIVSMIQDAHTDINNIQKSLVKNKRRVLYLDSLANFCFNYNPATSKDMFFYKVMVECIKHPYFVSPVERTISQLNNSGGMRLIQNPIAVDSIIFYQDATKKLINQQTYYELHLNALIEALEHIINMNVFPLNHETYQWDTGNNAFKTAKLVSHDNNQLIELGNKAKLFQGIVIYYIVLLEEVDNKAKDLSNSLKKEYKLE